MEYMTNSTEILYNGFSVQPGWHRSILIQPTVTVVYAFVRSNSNYRVNAEYACLVHLILLTSMNSDVPLNMECMRLIQ